MGRATIGPARARRPPDQTLALDPQIEHPYAHTERRVEISVLALAGPDRLWREMARPAYLVSGVGARAWSGVLNIDRLRAHPRRRPCSSDGVSGAGRGSRARRSVGCSYAAVDGDVEREPLGKRALGGRVSAKIILIDTAYGPFPSKKREAAKTY